MPENYLSSINIKLTNRKNNIKNFFIKYKIFYLIQFFLCVSNGYFFFSYFIILYYGLDEYLYTVLLLIGTFSLFIFLCSKYLSRFWYRSTLYFALFIITIVYSHFVISSFGYKDTYAESARCILSTLIGSEATILAIIVSISLVVIQQTITYSPNLVNIFKKIKTNPDFYILLAVYIFTILYEVWILKQIKEVDKDNNLVRNFEFYRTMFPEFELHIQLTYSLFAFLLVSLLPYTLNILDLIKPQKITEIEFNILKEKNVLDYIRDRQLEDPFSPIFDLITKTQNEETLDRLFNVIEKSAFKLLESGNLINLEVEEISKLINYFSSKIYAVGKNAVENKSEYSALKSIMFLSKITVIAIKINNKKDSYQIKDEIYQIIQWIKQIEKIAFDNKMENTISDIIRAYAKIEKAAINNNVETIYLLILQFAEGVGNRSNEQKMESALFELELFFKDMVDIASRKEMEKFNIKLKESFKQVYNE